MPTDSNPTELFDPLAVENIGVTLAVELLEQPLHTLPPSSKFSGAGIYALYYGGDLPAYAQLRALDKAEGGWRIPIYIGKAVRQNAKKGFSAKPVTERKLYNRIRAHARSIAEASNLEAADFRCRYLVLNDAYIALAEAVLITTFRPAWNGMGLGSNVTGAPRMEGQASQWDSLHPGRKGRPTGSSDDADAAAKVIADAIAALAVAPEDQRTAAMIEKIRRRASPGDAHS
jgi:hypothetical protein